jgi:hypothetical protein
MGVSVNKNGNAAALENSINTGYYRKGREDNLIFGLEI